VQGNDIGLMAVRRSDRAANNKLKAFASYGDPASLPRLVRSS